MPDRVGVVEDANGEDCRDFGKGFLTGSFSASSAVMSFHWCRYFILIVKQNPLVISVIND